MSVAVAAAPVRAEEEYYEDDFAPEQKLAQEHVLPVPRVTIYPGDVITENMLSDRPFFGAEYEGRGFAGSQGDLVGKVARQTLLPHLPIAATAVREPHAVVQGRPAVVYFQSGALIISATAMPLQAGVAGEVISLRNTDSGTTIRGVVQADGTVRVGLP
ncbi:flagellar basal body P-ring formation chaperone FlgA [Hyphomicrobium sp.]|nr:flagellar basal body P-ring formation chaperone FlgA [Hyphomicrobium sp.]HRQ28396.1 flagellar basal body P-ring formation chaperone FlgA [Hyphomicrobium sp.]